MSDGTDSVSFGNELGHQLHSHHHTLKLPSDKQYTQLEFTREVCQMKLNQLLSQQLTTRHSKKQDSSNLNSNVSMDDYYALLKRCLDAEAKVEKQSREIEQIKRKHMGKVQLLEDQIRWLKGMNVRFAPESRNKEIPNLRIETDFDENDE